MAYKIEFTYCLEKRFETFTVSKWYDKYKIDYSGGGSGGFICDI